MSRASVPSAASIVPETHSTKQPEIGLPVNTSSAATNPVSMPAMVNAFALMPIA